MQGDGTGCIQLSWVERVYDFRPSYEWQFEPRVLGYDRRYLMSDSHKMICEVCILIGCVPEFYFAGKSPSTLTLSPFLIIILHLYLYGPLENSTRHFSAVLYPAILLTTYDADWRL